MKKQFRALEKGNQYKRSEAKNVSKGKRKHASDNTGSLNSSVADYGPGSGGGRQSV
jgi:hypothetical protein